ncbi:MAG: protein kinase domain-containing protein [Gemmatimonadales bacterium]
MTDALSRLSAALTERYRISRELGAGGMATVYLAHDVRHDRPVALKVLRPELAAILGGERFLKEIRLTANLQHPHILGLHDSGEADGLVYYVMPYVEGESLRERLAREHQLPVEDVIRIATEVAGALDYAHRHSVIHRDIKPENILLHDGSAMVADFGIALAASRSDSGSRLTETGMSLGTPHYMSPEQAMGEREITAKSDVYALGCVVYEMLSGEPPFTGPTAQAIVARVMMEQPRSLTLQRHSIPPHVEAAVNRALEKLPADRFASAAQFAEALTRPDLTLPTTRAQIAARGPASTRWRGAFGLAVGTAAVALVLAAWGWLRVRSATRQPTTWQYISLGDSVVLTTQFPAMALSPDGSMFVFKDDRQNGRLWIKRPGELNPTPISGTERAQNPVFSPDGEWVAYVADGRLKKVRASGGASVTLADSTASGFGGAAWLDDGTLVYVSPSLQEMRRVNAAGGPSTVAMRSGLASLAGGGAGMPVALPGARGVLFQNCGSSCVTMSVHVLDLRTGQERLLFNDAAQAWYLPSGHLLYVRRDGVALVAPFDLGRLEITGAATPVLEGVQVSSNGGFALLTWSSSGTLVYAHGAGGSTDNAMVRVSRDGAIAQIDTAWHGEFNSIALSHDGRRLAVGLGLGAALNIWIKQLDRGPFTRLTFGGQDRRPFWSPDGRTVAYIRDSSNTSAVYARADDGGGQDRELVRLDRLIQEGEWSRDGRWILVRTDNGQAGAGDILAARASGDGAPVPVAASPFTELHPALSPDGRWLAYTSNESGINEVYVRPFPDAQGGRWQVSNGGGSEPRWSRDGRELFHLDGDNRMNVVQIRTVPTFAAAGRTSLFNASNFVLGGFHQSYDVTPDGRAFVFVSPRRAGAQGAAQLVWADRWLNEVAARLAR